MAPRRTFRRGRSANPEVANDREVSKSKEADADLSARNQSARERRKNPTSSEPRSSRKKKVLPEDEHDPYDSDPGESYRDHCMRMKGVNTRSCLAMPKFLKAPKELEEHDTIATAPASPLASEIDDFIGNTPASLPRELSRVKYSLRTSIGDGSQKQPAGPSVMERRQLRPNNVHLNVSHWSNMGGRNYMEDR
jgi:hypothetical protein